MVFNLYPYVSYDLFYSTPWAIAVKMYMLTDYPLQTTGKMMIPYKL